MKKKVPYLGLLITLALILSYVESLLPFHFGVPGMKLGLPNLVTVLTLYLYGPGEAAVVSALRIVLSGFLFGNLFGILYSLAGAIFSFAVMVFLKSRKCFSITGISMAGGTAHNMGQLAAAVLIVDNYNLGLYAPILLIAGLATGFLIGASSAGVYGRIRNFMER